MFPDVAAVRPVLVNWIVIVSATLYDRFVNVATPFVMLTVVAPWRAPVPVSLAAVTVPLAVVTRLLFASSTQITGCVANIVPAVLGVEGAVAMTSLDAAAAVFVRWNNAGLAAPVTLAVSTNAPDVVFAVNAPAVAIPAADVVAVVLCTEPAQVPVAPEFGEVNVTVAPLTGLA